MNDEQKEYVKSIYYNTKGEASFSSIKSLYAKIKSDGLFDISMKNLSDFMKTQEVYTSHLSSKRPRHHLPIVSPNPNHGLELDSAVLPFKDDNEKPYIVVGIDQYSHKIKAIPVKTLSADAVNDAVKSILRHLGSYSIVRTDKGTDYLNSKVRKTFRDNRIRHIYSYPPNKSVLAESAIRRIKNKLYKVLQHKGEKQWEPYLDDIIDSINSTKTSSLAGYSPNEVTDDKVGEIWFHRLHRDLKRQPKHRPFKLKIGDAVRIRYSRGLNPFAKEYSEKMGAKVYYVHDRYNPSNFHLYKLKDDRGDLVPGRFKPHELQQVIITQDTMWRIDGDPIRYRVRNGVREALVDWLDYDESYRSWIPADQIRQLKAGDNEAIARPARRRRRRAR